MSIILGINGAPFFSHDPGAALIIDGEVKAVVEEERLNRIKKSIDLPPVMSVKEVLNIAKVNPQEVDIITLPWMPSAMGYDNDKTRCELMTWAKQQGLTNDNLEVNFVEHHVAHAWSGIGYSGINKYKNIGILVLDGSGESTSGAAFIFNQKNGLKQLWQLEQESSMGIYYEAATIFLGFSWGSEGKTMGLASYGRHVDLSVPSMPDSRYNEPLRIWHSSNGSPKHKHERIRKGLIKKHHDLFNKNLMSFNDKADLALSVQNYVAKRIETYLLEFIEEIDALILCGGIALNCTINDKIARLLRNKGKTLLVPPPANDTGVALGAALFSVENPEKILTLDNPYLSRNYSPSIVISYLKEKGFKVVEGDISVICENIFEKNLICGWFEGRSEIGPRALGKRCIIAPVNNTILRNKLNYLKGREFWRPIAPSMTENCFNSFFPDSIPSPFMLINAQLKGGDISDICGVVHVDGTSRVQTVFKDSPYKQMLKSAGKISSLFKRTKMIYNQYRSARFLRGKLRTVYACGFTYDTTF